jgi:hypothetical protein
VLVGKRRFSCSGNTIGKWNAILPAHPVVELAVCYDTRPDDIATPGKLDALRERSSSRQAGPSRDYSSEGNQRHPSPGSIRSFVPECISLARRRE